MLMLVSIFERPIEHFVCFHPHIWHKVRFSNALGDTAYSQEHLKAIVNAKLWGGGGRGGGQTKCIMVH